MKALARVYLFFLIIFLTGWITFCGGLAWLMYDWFGLALALITGGILLIISAILLLVVLANALERIKKEGEDK